MEKVLEGKLASFEVPDLLTFLNMGRRTGALIMERSDEETKIFFADGNPVFACTTRSELRLGNMLVKAGRLTTVRIDELFARHGGSGHRLGQMLLSEKVLSEGELASFLKIQVSEIIFDTFEWSDGAFSLFDGVEPPAAAVTLKMDLQNLIMEGVRRIDERGRIKEALPDLDLVVEAVANPERVKQSVTFTKEEWQVFFLVDGRRSLREICSMIGNPDEMETLQILYHLLTANFISLGPAEPGREAAAEVEPKTVPPRPEPKPPQARPPVSPAGTQKVPLNRVIDDGESADVEFVPARPRRRAADDARDVVSREAVGYMQDDSGVTVSRLVMIKDGGEQPFPLTRDSYTLGRHRNNDIVIGDAKVSGFHARLDRSPEGFLLVDLKSRNGVFVNGQRAVSQVLQTNDEIRMGAARLVYRVDYKSKGSA